MSIKHHVVFGEQHPYRMVRFRHRTVRVHVTEYTIGGGHCDDRVEEVVELNGTDRWERESDLRRWRESFRGEMTTLLRERANVERSVWMGKAGRGWLFQGVMDCSVHECRHRRRLGSIQNTKRMVFCLKILNREWTMVNLLYDTVHL